MIHKNEILDLGDYERQRDEIRRKAIAARGLRRVEAGPNATISFENRETLRYQIQEMLRAERIAKPAEVDHEIETYNELLPGPLELSATMMLEFEEPVERAKRLAELVGIEDHLRLDIDGAGSASAKFDRRQIAEERVSSVQFIRFPLTREQRKAIDDGARITVVFDHPKYSHQTPMRAEAVEALRADLREAGDADV